MVIFKGEDFLIKYKWLFLLTLLLNPCLAQSSTNLPLDHWAYSSLEKLTSFGLVDSSVIGTKPFSRLEIARLIIEAKERREDKNEFIDHILKRLEDEFKDELEIIKEGTSQHIFYKLIDTIDIKYGYLRGTSSTFSYIRLPDIKDTSLWYNNDGITYKEGNNTIIDFSARGGLFNFLSFYYQPLLTKNSKDNDVETFKIYLKCLLDKFELQVGKDSLWWGQGYHGSLILTNNAKPLKFIKLSNHTPILLPWIFSHLGAFKGTFFASKLEEDRVVKEPKLFGIRANFKPHPLLELGASGIIMAEGEGRPKLQLKDILTFIKLKHLYKDGKDAANNIMVLDGRLQIPILRNTEIYCEYGGEDTGGTIIGLGDIAYLYGIYIPRLTNDGKTQMRIEYANTVRRESKSGIVGWYHHGIYQSGYTYKGLILGHHMGGDSEDFYLQLQRYLKNNLIVNLEFDNEKRGVDKERQGIYPQETHKQVRTQLSYDINDKLEVNLKYGYDKVSNFNRIRDNNQNNYLAEIEFVSKRY